MKYDYRRTRIIFTIGPATESDEALEQLIRQGVDICRINMAHASPEWTRTVIRRIRAASERAGREIAIMMDVKGPEVRTGDVETPMELRPGEVFDFTVRPEAKGENDEEVRSVNVNYRDLVNDIQVGDTVLVDNGVIRMEVLEKNQARIRCRVMIPGTLGSRRHINLPGVRVNLPALTEKDKRDVLVGLEEGIDLVALSFVRDKADIKQLRAFLTEHHSPAAIIAKIEDQQAIENLDEIILEADCLMVARGDLGIECPYEELPIIQRRAVKTCLRVGKPVIIATHMLESMISSPMPTRAEITDVANAVYEQADCVMLSGETSVGVYPHACVDVLDRIARRIERSGGAGFADLLELGSDKARMLRAAVVMANELESAGLLVFTRRGFMAEVISALRPRRTPIFAFTNSLDVQRRLSMHWGIVPFFLNLSADPEVSIASAVNILKERGCIQKKDCLVVVSNMLAHDRLIDTVQMRVVD
jgi:pyruvate kinase